jgi:2-polyprenyl-3-methyl-5-hydroxy-6-metoxy-1,4-benzoquinol methylase
MFDELKKINAKPKAFEFYTTKELWTEEHVSKQMLKFHLNEDVDAASRNSKFVNKSVEWITSYFNIAGKKIADFGCGPGLYANKLAKKCGQITAIDFSKRSLEYAKNIADEEGLEVNYVNQNYLEFETDEKFDLIIMIMCDYCAMSGEQRKVMLNKFYDVLRPGGKVLLDAYSLAAYNGRKETAIYEQNLMDGFWSANEYFGFLNIFKYDDEKVVLDKYTIIEKNRTRTIYNWLKYFSIEEIKQ